jgi:outer membrane protein
MSRKIRTLTLLAASLATAGAVQAQDWTFKTSVTRYTTDSKSDGLMGIGLPPGSDAETGNATTALLILERRLSDNLGIELALGIPPRIKARATGPVAFLGEVVSAKLLAPALILNYHFGSPGDTWRPYVGAGISYVKFDSIRTQYPFDVEIKDAVGPIVQAGIDFAIDRQWGGFASVALPRTKTDLVGVGATVLTTTIDFRPVVYSVGISYKF